MPEWTFALVTVPHGRSEENSAHHLKMGMFMLITGAAIKNTCVFGKKVHAVALRLHKNQLSFVFFLSPTDGCQQDWVYARRRQRLTLLMHLISPVKANPPGQGCREQGRPHCWYRVTGLTWISEVHYTVCQSIISRHPFHGYSCRIQTWNHSIQVRINWGEFMSQV